MSDLGRNIEIAQSEEVRFRWTSVNDQQFRVLRVLENTSQVEITLEIHETARAPQYFALSYAWGARAATETIKCNGKDLYVTPHLKDGLRNVSTASGQNVLWVDAICINQEDDVEKARQVAQIYQIFRNAKAVLVWLGTAQDDSEAALARMIHIKDSIPPLPDDISEALFAPRTSERNRLFDLSLFRPLALLSRRLWFRRLWISQEYIYGKGVFIICGATIMEASAFVKVTMSLSIYSFGGTEPEGVKEFDDLFAGFRMLHDIHKIKTGLQDESTMSLYDVIMSGRARETFEPVDRIYAVIGMAEGKDMIYQKQLVIDYSEEARLHYWRLYSKFGKLALHQEPHLSLLSEAMSSTAPQNLPSWCPNLNSQSEVNALSETYAAGWPEKNHQSWNAAALPASRSCVNSHGAFVHANHDYVETSDVSEKVFIWGASVDVVSIIGTTPEWSTNFDSDNLVEAKPFASEMLQWLDECLNICLGVYSDLAMAKWVSGEVLVGANAAFQDNPVGPSAAGTSNKEDMLELLKRVLKAVTVLVPDLLQVEQQSVLQEYFSMMYVWVMSLEEAWHNRKLFATRRGLIGYSSHRILPGDRLCMLYSGRTMYILRPRSDSGTYQYVGDAYVFRCMKGEVFDMMHIGTATEERFAIQ